MLVALFRQLYAGTFFIYYSKGVVVVDWVLYLSSMVLVLARSWLPSALGLFIKMSSLGSWLWDVRHSDIITLLNIVIRPTMAQENTTITTADELSIVAHFYCDNEFKSQPAFKLKLKARLMCVCVVQFICCFVLLLKLLCIYC